MGVKHTPMASAGARAYNGGLGAEPPAGVQGAEPPVGRSPPAADEVFVLIFNVSATVLHEMMYCLSCLHPPPFLPPLTPLPSLPYTIIRLQLQIFWNDHYLW